MDIRTAIAAFVFFAALLVFVAAWLWGPPLAIAWRRARVRRQSFPPAWRDTLRRRWPAFAQFPADVQLQLKKQAQVLIAETPFVGCAGLAITDDMRVLIAAQAALLLLNGRANSFANLRQVLVYPGAFVVDRAVADDQGLAHEIRRVLAGESWQQGQLILSWQDVVTDAAQAADASHGRNVVIHEAAHQLDQETGAANGAPALRSAVRRKRWAQVMSQAYSALQLRVARHQPGLIDAYGATDPAEFFAVATELFITRPEALAAAHPALYDELAQLYRASPLLWRSSPVLLRSARAGNRSH
ncbi:MAG: zinc-dependent peptidase [Rubrivivax sp.]|nr:zinc-dependent peptidase [Rubrivivax sp.]